MFLSVGLLQFVYFQYNKVLSPPLLKHHGPTCITLLHLQFRLPQSMGGAYFIWLHCTPTRPPLHLYQGSFGGPKVHPVVNMGIPSAFKEGREPGARLWRGFKVSCTNQLVPGFSEYVSSPGPLCTTKYRGCGRGAQLRWACTLSPSKEVWLKSNGTPYFLCNAEFTAV